MSEKQETKNSDKVKKSETNDISTKSEKKVDKNDLKNTNKIQPDKNKTTISSEKKVNIEQKNKLSLQLRK